MGRWLFLSQRSTMKLRTSRGPSRPKPMKNASGQLCLRNKNEKAPVNSGFHFLREPARTGLSQGQIVRNQLEKAKTTKVDKPFMRLAGIMRGPKDLSQRKGYSTKS